MAKADRIEVFCQEIIKGKSQRQAYYIAYPSSKKWKEKTVDNRASELCNTREVLGRLEELRKEAENANKITRDNIISELKNIGFSRISDYAEINGPIVRIKTLNEMSQEQIGAIASLEQGNYGIKLKLCDKLKALEMIIKTLGYDKTEPDENLEDTSEAESEVFGND